MYRDDLETQDIIEIENMLSVNIYPMTFLSHALIPSLLQRFEQTQRRSLILNISSLAAVKSTHDITVYAATKAYNDFLSRALSYEYSKAITVTSLRPGVVLSQISKKLKVDKAALGMVSAESYAKQSLKRLGTRATSGHLLHMVLAEILDCVPQMLFNLLSTLVPKEDKKTK
jgi:17beta-estradiol 17-dehydrogenase / very-long-chain 3-oxoacyl-CoA reductase